MNWIDAKAKYDQGSRLIKVGLDMIQESIEMMEKLNEGEKSDSSREAVHDSSSNAGVYRVS